MTEENIDREFKLKEINEIGIMSLRKKSKMN